VFRIWNNVVYPPLSVDQLKGAQVVVLMFDLGSKESLERLKDEWLLEVNSSITEKQARFLIGNKSDLSTEDRQVSEEEAKILASEQIISYFEISCKDKVNIEETFIEIARVYKSGGSFTVPPLPESYQKFSGYPPGYPRRLGV
jgi:GTPase SAR1 family protein